MEARIERALLALVLGSALSLGACRSKASETVNVRAQEASQSQTEQQPQSRLQQREQATAVFAGGCFWCLEPPFDEVDGVLNVESGYAGGRVDNPSYEQVSAGGTGHFEVVRVSYDPKRVSYEKLLEVFWQNVDPLDSGGQFCDRGDQYRSALFVDTPNERALAEVSLNRVAKRFERQGTIATTIEPAVRFYPAEKYHQDYYEKNPVRYKYYRYRCGRDARLDELWGER